MAKCGYYKPSLFWESPKCQNPEHPGLNKYSKEAKLYDTKNCTNKKFKNCPIYNHNILSLLSELKELKEANVINEEEFYIKKKKILDDI